ncbi:MAG: hypothetical protein AB7F43_07670 [Bacteriovoracia bacterium]
MFIISMTLAFSENDPLILLYTKPIIWCVLFITLGISLIWTLRPAQFLEKFSKITQLLVDSGAKQLSKIETQDSKNLLGKIQETLKTHGKLLEFILKTNSLFDKPQVILVLFLTLFSYVLTATVLIFAALYKIAHFSIPGGIFSNQDGSVFSASFSDFLFISSREFFGSEPYGIIVSPSVRSVLVMENISAFFLLVVVILAFSTVTPKTVESKVSKTEEEITKQGLQLVETFTSLAESLNSIERKPEPPSSNSPKPPCIEV